MSITNPDQDIADAQALYESLEERVRAGDESVTSEELDQARGLSRFARLRKEAAQRKAAQARRDAAAGDVREAAEAAREYLDGVGGIDEQKAALADALKAWADEARETLDGLRRHADRLLAANYAAEQLGVPDSWEAHDIRGGADGMFTIRNVRRFHDEEHRQFEPTHVLRELCEAAGLQLVGEVRWASRG